MVEELDPSWMEVPRWRGEGEPSETERKHYVDDRLGLDIIIKCEVDSLNLWSPPRLR